MVLILLYLDLIFFKGCEKLLFRYMSNNEIYFVYKFGKNLNGVIGDFFRVFGCRK